MTPTEGASPYYIEDRLLLRFLIKRYTEMGQTNNPNLSPVWRGLGLVGLHKNGELKNAFEILISSESYTVKEVLETSLDLFMAELSRLQGANTYYECPEKPKSRPFNTRKTSKLLYLVVERKLTDEKGGGL